MKYKDICNRNITEKDKGIGGEMGKNHINNNVILHVLICDWLKYVLCISNIMRYHSLY